MMAAALTMVLPIVVIVPPGPALLPPRHEPHRHGRALMPWRRATHG